MCKIRTCHFDCVRLWGVGEDLPFPQLLVVVEANSHQVAN